MGLIQFMEKTTRLRNAMEKEAASVMKQKALKQAITMALNESIKVCPVCGGNKARFTNVCIECNKQYQQVRLKRRIAKPE